ncbi:MAG: hypothetical protein GWM90_27930 [Gemmatimonadetes bacterium]|nr:hypothetical protein [Gemmatimonadota bacterium]NIQ58846.1 hypothetical protein [Gemmatimonadota bacterium]NIU79014.1 hypothetical protein [Gammaproteobacteria bacterium]NIX47758.1 hypothetical protein [Gemmatimonadota bacterium]NIY12116.1 hypothetical protein [Gemmatimonadota bacterium]
MKKLLRAPLALALLLGVPAVAGAQVPALDRGSLLLDGQASLTSAGVDGQDDRTTNLTLTPSIQYFVTRGLALGADAVLGRSSSGDFTSTAYGIGPTATYYWILDANVHPFLSGSVLFGSTNRETPVGEIDSSETQLRGAVGLLFLLTDAVGVNTELFYAHRSLEVEDLEEDSDVYGLAVGISAFIF